MSGPTLDEQVQMVTDLYEVEWLEADRAVAILRDSAKVSAVLSAILIRDEMRLRDEQVAARDSAAEQAARDDDGTWSP